MAKKKQVEKPEMPVVAEPETKTKPVRLDLTLDVHAMLRVVAAERGLPMAVFAREQLVKLVRELYDAKPR